jgi:hypothetical protein
MVRLGRNTRAIGPEGLEKDPAFVAIGVMRAPNEAKAGNYPESVVVASLRDIWGLSSEDQVVLHWHGRNIEYDLLSEAAPVPIQLQDAFSEGYLLKQWAAYGDDVAATLRRFPQGIYGVPWRSVKDSVKDNLF